MPALSVAGPWAESSYHLAFPCDFAGTVDVGGESHSAVAAVVNMGLASSHQEAFVVQTLADLDLQAA